MASPATPYLLADGTKPMTGEIAFNGNVGVKSGTKLEIAASNGQIISWSATDTTVTVKNETTGAILIQFSKE